MDGVVQIALMMVNLAYSMDTERSHLPMKSVSWHAITFQTAQGLQFQIAFIHTLIGATSMEIFRIFYQIGLDIQYFRQQTILKFINRTGELQMLDVSKN